MSKRHSVFLGFLILTLSACTSLGLITPDTVDSKLAYAYGVHTAVLTTAAAEVKSHQLSVTEGQTILKLADQSRILLDEAKALETTDVKTAMGKVTLATSVLDQIQKFLKGA